MEGVVDFTAGLSKLTNETANLSNSLENLSSANVTWLWLIIGVEGVVNTRTGLSDLTHDVANLSHGLESLVGAVTVVVKVNELVLHFQK